MLINLVSYLNPFEYQGGGEVVNQALIKKGQDRGHKFQFTSARSRLNNYSSNANLDILIDVHNYPHTLKSRGAWIKLENNLLTQIITNRPFIHMTNAYADICNLGYLPCSGLSSKHCIHKSKIKTIDKLTNLDFQNQCFAFQAGVKESYVNSLMNVYVSPLHKKITNEVINYNDDEKSLILKPIIDVDKFQVRDIERDIDYLFVGVLSEAKGFYNLKNFGEKEKIVFAGDVHPSIKLDFGKHLGKLSYEEVIVLMNRAKNFIFLPRWPEPQGRVVVEAALMGCNLIVNENVGATTFSFNLADITNYVDSADIFWDQIELIAS